MDYEEEWEEVERVQPCKECEYLQDRITELTIKVREVESAIASQLIRRGFSGGTRLYEKRKRMLNWAVEAQQRHQSEHDHEDDHDQEY